MPGKIGRVPADAWPVLGILLLYAAVTLIVNPQLEGFLNDDWTYTKSTLQFHRTGMVEDIGRAQVTLLFHIFWGNAFLSALGESVTALRISTIVLAAIGAIAFYFLVREFGASRRLAFLFSLVYSLNPYSFNLAFTFMTDAGFMALVVISLLFSVKFIKSGYKDGRFFVLSIIFYVIILTSRQIGIIVPISVFLYMLLNGDLKANRLKAISIISIPFAALAVLSYWLYAVAGSVGTALLLSKPAEFAENVIKLSISWVQYSSLFLLPIALAYAMHMKNMLKEKKAAFILALVFVASATAGYHLILGKLPNPFMEAHMFYNLGLGPFTLKDTYFEDKLPPVTVDPSVWIGLTAATSLGAVLILSTFLGQAAEMRNRFRRKTGLPVIAVAYIMTALYLLILAALDSRMDRYNLLLIIPVSLVLAENFGRKKMAFPVFAAALVVMASFSVAATNDYLEWNRARYQAIGYLTEEAKISPEKIDGGFEFNRYLFWPRPSTDRTMSWWSVIDDEYIVSFSRLDGYSVFREFPYRSILNPEGRILVLKRI